MSNIFKIAAAALIVLLVSDYFSAHSRCVRSFMERPGNNSEALAHRFCNLRS